MSFLNNLPTLLPMLVTGIIKGAPAGAVVAVVWLILAPYVLTKYVLNSFLRLLPGSASKPIYAFGDSISDSIAKAAKPVAPVLEQVNDWRSDRFYRRWAINLLSLAVVAVIAFYLGNQINTIVSETEFSLLGQGIGTDFPSGFIKIDSEDLVWVAILKGLGNTLALVIITIVFASFIGLLVGIARLAKHPIISGFAGLYTEMFRNVPLLALMLLLNAAVFRRVLPLIEDSWAIPRVFYVSNRGVAVPSTAIGHEFWWIWGICFVMAIAVALFLRRYLILKEQATGGNYRPGLYSFIAFVGVSAVTYLIFYLAFGFNVPIGIDLPILDTETSIVARYAGGFQLSTVFFAAVLGLILYFSAFIAEIVRGSIQAISHGQTEAANSLGLSAYQRFSLIILPQALTIMIPSLNNEYQNVNKDSAVAFIIGYAETLFVIRQLGAESGALLPLLITSLLIYMSVNLVISFIMNSINRLNKVAR